MKQVSFLLLLLFNYIALYAQKNALTHSVRIDSFVARQMRETGIPGMAVAVVHDGKVVHAKAYGVANIEWKSPATKSTAFQIASVTKLFTATLILKWIAQGKIGLDDYVNKYLDDAPDTWSRIQIKHLLSHQSGIPWPGSIGGFIGVKPSESNKVPTKEEIYQSLKDSALSYVPGTKEAYANGDHFLLQIILEKIGGKPFPQLMKETVLTPLQMTESGYDEEIREMPVQVMKPLAQKTQLFTKGASGLLIFKSFYNQASYTSAGLYMSLNDAVKWAIALDRGNFINHALTDSLYAPMPLNGSFTKLGWIREEIGSATVYGHSGGPGLGYILRIPQSKATIIVFTNYTDLLPYIANVITGYFINENATSEEVPQERTLERGFDKRL